MRTSPLLTLRVLVLLVVTAVSCSRQSEKKVLVHYFPFARGPYASIPLTSAEMVPGTFSFSVDADNRSIRRVIDSLGSADSGTFNRQDVRLVIRLETGEFLAVDAQGGVVNRGREGKLRPERIKEVAATIEAMPENPLSHLIKD